MSAGSLSLRDRCLRLAPALCWLAIALGAMVLSGWVLGIEELKSIRPGITPMRPATALALILSATAMFGLIKPAARSSLMQWLALGAAALLLVLAAVDPWVSMPGVEAVLSPGSATSGALLMAPQTVLAFTLILAAQFILLRRKSPELAQGIGLLALAFPLLAVTAYAFGAEYLFGTSRENQMALITALGILPLALALLLATAECGFVRVLLGPDEGGRIARRLLPAAIGIPLLFGWLRLVGEQAGLYEVQTGVALTVVASFMLLAALIYSSASHISREIGERNAAEAELRDYKAGLEQQVALRTQELAATNAALQREVEDRRTAEAALEQSRQLYRTLFDNANDAVIIFEPDGETVLEVNHKACELYGYSREEFLGLSLAAITTDYERGIDEVRSTMRFKGSRDLELVQKRRDGQQILVSISATVIEFGNRLAIMSVNHDVTHQHELEQERQRLEQQLRQAQKMEAIGTLAGGIAHDFNNILYAIHGNAELVLERLAPGGSDWENQMEVLRGSRRASDLVRQILTFSRQTSSAREPVDLIELVAEVGRMMRATLPATIEIRQTLPAGRATVLADPIEIHQVLMNLCTNAWQAMQPAGGVLEIALKSLTLAEALVKPMDTLLPGDYHQLTVSDTGDGINPDIQGRIFDPFFTTKAVGEGTGIGLSLVHGIVSSLGGTVTVYSEPGRGSTFTVYLPKLEAEVRQPEQRRVLEGTERVLFIDDEPALVRMGTQMLERQGYRVTAFADSLEALACYRDDPFAFDIVVTDETMPGMRGSELAAAITRLRPDLPVILCTGFGLQEDLLLQNPAVREVLLKPVTGSSLTRAIRAQLDGQVDPVS
jgi:PAS domain S-box-containing protein